MKIKTITLIGILFLTLNAYAQLGRQYEGVYIAVGYEVGLLSVDLENTNNPPFRNIDVSNNRLRHSISFLTAYRTTAGLDFRVGYLPSQNIIGFKGDDIKKKFKIQNSYFSHMALAGIGYNIPLSRSFDVRIGVDASMTFVGNNQTESINGEDNTKMVVTNNTVKNNNIHIIAPISFVKHFQNGNYFAFGAKYYHSLSESFIDGDISIQKADNTILNQAKYNTKNNAIALFINYGFKIQSTFDDCGCLF